MLKGRFTKEVTSESTPEGSERVNHAEIWGKQIPEQPMQRPWGRPMPGVLEEQLGGRVTGAKRVGGGVEEEGGGEGRDRAG